VFPSRLKYSQINPIFKKGDKSAMSNYRPISLLTSFSKVFEKVIYKSIYEMWCWRRMEKISWTDHVRNEEVLLRVSEQRNILHKIRKWKANWIGHIVRRNCLVKEVIEGKIKGQIEVTRRRGRRRKQLQDDLGGQKRILSFEGGSSRSH
jgi:hypothetical protein